MVSTKAFVIFFYLAVASNNRYAVLAQKTPDAAPSAVPIAAPIAAPSAAPNAAPNAAPSSSPISATGESPAELSNSSSSAAPNNIAGNGPSISPVSSQLNQPSAQPSSVAISANCNSESEYLYNKTESVAIILNCTMDSSPCEGDIGNITGIDEYEQLCSEAGGKIYQQDIMFECGDDIIVLTFDSCIGQSCSVVEGQKLFLTTVFPALASDLQTAFACSQKPDTGGDNENLAQIIIWSVMAPFILVTVGAWVCWFLKKRGKS